MLHVGYEGHRDEIQPASAPEVGTAFDIPRKEGGEPRDQEEITRPSGEGAWPGKTGSEVAGNEIRHHFGVEPEALTFDEAFYLRGFRDADTLRARVVSARYERGGALRLPERMADFGVVFHWRCLSVWPLAML